MATIETYLIKKSAYTIVLTDLYLHVKYQVLVNHFPFTPLFLTFSWVTSQNNSKILKNQSGGQILHFVGIWMLKLCQGFILKNGHKFWHKYKKLMSH